MRKTSQVLKDSGIIDSKNENDTIRLWESYRDQAILWRALTLIQVPATFLAIIFALVMWTTRSIVIDVPHKPLPGLYAIQEIPDSEFINTATNAINLIATYQPAVARRQFTRAREYLVEPMLSQFDKEMLDVELRAIESSRVTQLFFADPTKTTIQRVGRDVQVSMSGERVRYVSGRETPTSTTDFTVTLSTIPRNDLNPYGIVIKSITVHSVPSRRN